jgi:hypothetical protein
MQKRKFFFSKDSKVIFQNEFNKMEGVYNVIPLSPLEVNGKNIFMDA